MGAALVLLLVGLGSIAAGVLIGRYYVPDDRQLRRTARHARAYMRAISHLIARDTETVIDELRTVVEENIDDVEPYFALGAMFRSRGEHERAIRVHQALALRERDRRKLRHRALYELGLDFRAAGMPRRATRAMEDVLLDEPGHEGALRALASLYEEQARFEEAAGLWQRLGAQRGEDTSQREHHLLVAAAQAALAHGDPESAKLALKAAQKHGESPHFFAAAAELAAARGNFRGTKERLRQALLAEPALAPHLLPGLIAAEERLDGTAPPFGGAAGQAQVLAGDGTAPRFGGAAGQAQVLAGDGTAPRFGGAAGQAQVLAGDGTAPRAAADELAEDTAPADGAPQLAESSATAPAAAGADASVALVPDARPHDGVTARVLATLAEIEAQTGPRLELALIRAQLGGTATPTGDADLAGELATKFPGALAARVAAARRALAGGDDRAIKHALDTLAGERGALAWALRGRWQCASCGHRPGSFSWRCGQCRRWATMRMETGVEPPPVPPRERREHVRARNDGLLGAAPDTALPAPTLDSGLTEDELREAGARRSLLGRVGGWFGNVWRRSAP